MDSPLPDPIVAPASATSPICDASVDNDSKIDMKADICPITHQRFIDPVVLSDGFTYERKAIVRWLKKHNTSPITRETVSQRLVPNRTLCQLLDINQTPVPHKPTQDENNDDNENENDAVVEREQEMISSYYRRGFNVVYGNEPQRFSRAISEHLRAAPTAEPTTSLQPVYNQLGEHDTETVTGETDMIEQLNFNVLQVNTDPQFGRVMEEALRNLVTRSVTTTSIGYV